MCSANEASGRYSILKDEFYFPSLEDVSIQSNTNKQGGEINAPVEVAQKFIDYLEKLTDESYEEYEGFLTNDNIAREQARICLPVNLYTEWYWKIDLHNLLHFMALRCDSHAQYEIRVFSNAILELVKPLVPFTIEAWEDYHFRRGGLLLTRLEAEVLKEVIIKNNIDLSNTEINSDNKREKQEWKEKIKRLMK
jgi:thymidylate synthase (FAD)